MQLIFDTLDERGITQTWLARRLGIRDWTLTRYKTGHTPVPDDVVRRACEILGLPYSAVVQRAAEFPERTIPAPDGEAA